jgi:hypothetical protein
MIGRAGYRKFSIGLKLSSFIGTEDELDIMSVLHHIKDELPAQITIKLWYNEGEIKRAQMKKFMQDWGDLLADYGSQMFCLTENNNRSYNAWFNIFTREESKQVHNVGRFQYYCEDNQVAWMGIFSFINILNFHCKNESRDDTHTERKSTKYESRYSRKS